MQCVPESACTRTCLPEQHALATRDEHALVIRGALLYSRRRRVPTAPATNEALAYLGLRGALVHLEVAPAESAALDAAVLATNGTVAAYATDGGSELELNVRELMSRNLRYQFVLVYTVPAAAKDQAVADVAVAVADGALGVGEHVGLPLHRFPLERTADAHDAVEGGAVGKVLVDIS
jgi:NADPH:quinone reductase